MFNSWAGASAEAPVRNDTRPGRRHHEEGQNVGQDSPRHDVDSCGAVVQ